MISIAVIFNQRGHNQKQVLFFLDNLAVVMGCLTLQDKYNISSLSKTIKFICTHCETGQKISQKYSQLCLFLKLYFPTTMYVHCLYITHVTIVHSLLPKSSKMTIKKQSFCQTSLKFVETSTTKYSNE